MYIVGIIYTWRVLCEIQQRFRVLVRNTRLTKNEVNLLGPEAHPCLFVNVHVTIPLSCGRCDGKLPLPEISGVTRSDQTEMFSSPLSDSNDWRDHMTCSMLVSLRIASTCSTCGGRSNVSDKPAD